MLISQNLYNALRMINQPGENPHCWIDQICINQSDSREKSLQVPLMGSIDGNATRVVIWLG